ncbi:hypothetical protein BC937DRAFT_89063 [Endogone sp. FLAS-F59071]|nr:hypothetical protein BC937DRAFT_89063 [Endogone sp. FLAS-F59071]|eukprot:RUS22456.1 hypothetical protein BC937DRAFT_89063 [Endogone sp. FLAS-F59071]
MFTLLQPLLFLPQTIITFFRIIKTKENMSNTQVYFRKVPTTYPVNGEHIEVVKTPFSADTVELADGDFLIKNLVLSVDPYMRGRMRNQTKKSYSPAFAIDAVLNGAGVSVVLRSKNENFKAGDYVYGLIGWEEYTVVRAAMAGSFQLRNEAKDSGLPISNYIGVLGMPGMTAYIGLYKFANMKAGETLFVSAAAGAVGQLVGQIGKINGLHVVGSVGDDSKAKYLIDECDFDAVFNYKTTNVAEGLAEHCPNGVDIYFENVGGKTLEAVIDAANNFARIVVCGMISQYNLENPEPVHNLVQIIGKRIRMEGFIVGDSAAEYRPAFVKDVTTWLKEGKIQYKEDVAVGIENAPEAFIGMLKGKNFGKQVVKIADA